MKKWMIGIFLALFIIPAVFAQGEPVVDRAGIFSETETVSLAEKAQALGDQYHLSVVLVAIDHYADGTIAQFADDYYDENGYQPDGLLFVVALDTREYYTSTAGKGISYLSDWEIDQMNEAAVSYLASGDYYKAYSAYLAEAEAMLSTDSGSAALSREENGQRLVLVSGSILLSFLVGLSAVLIMRGKMKTAREAGAADRYVVPGSFKLTQQQDIFLYRTHVSIPLPQNNQNKPGGGGTSVHFGSSGASHGGGGGRF